jgi:hypothetical protein
MNLLAGVRFLARYSSMPTVFFFASAQEHRGRGKRRPIIKRFPFFWYSAQEAEME